MVGDLDSILHQRGDGVLEGEQLGIHIIDRTYWEYKSYIMVILRKTPTKRNRNDTKVRRPEETTSVSTPIRMPS